MHLIQILVPLRDNAGRRFPRRLHDQVKQELTERFTGLTAYTRAPAEGLWRKGKATQTDEIIIYEVMASGGNWKWWREYQAMLEKRFRQDSLVVRAFPIRELASPPKRGRKAAQISLSG